MARSRTVSSPPQSVVAFFTPAPSHDNYSTKSVPVDESTDLDAVVQRYVDLGAVYVVGQSADGEETVLYTDPGHDEEAKEAQDREAAEESQRTYLESLEASSESE